MELQEPAIEPVQNGVKEPAHENSENRACQTKHFSSQVNPEKADSGYSWQASTIPDKPGQIIDRQSEEFQDWQTENPLRPAFGRLKVLEDDFIRITQQSRSKPTNRQKITSLLDKYKRVYPNNEQLAELELFIKS